MAIIQHFPQTVNFGILAPGHSVDSRATFHVPIEANVTVNISSDSSGGGFQITRVRTYEPAPGNEHLSHPDLELVDETDGSAAFDVVPGDVIEVSIRFSPPANSSAPANLVTGVLSFRAIPTIAGGRWGATVPLFAEVGREAPRIKTPWAVLLVKWSDDKSEPFDRQFYDDFFTSSGIGTMNVVDFFRDASHGLLDLSGTKVFGWFDLDKKKSEYTGSGEVPLGVKGRQDLVDWSRKAALAALAKKGLSGALDGFSGFVVITNVFVDVWGGGGEAVSGGKTEGWMTPSVLSQEMGHGHGLSHSGADGSTAEYGDRWDVMSTRNAFMAPHPKYTDVGPSLNAWNMAGRGWLDESRVWNSGERFVTQVADITLRPLVRYDLPGLLAARVGEYLIEFRVKEGWDASIPEPAVLVHRFEGNRSFIMKSTDGRQDLVKGSVFQVGDEGNPFAAWSRVDVLDINAGEHTATVRIFHRANFRRSGGGIQSDPGIVSSGAADGGGGLIIVGGKFIRVPPRSPAQQILVQLAAIQSSDLITDATTRDAVREAALTAMAGHVQAQLGSVRTYHQPAPRKTSDDLYTPEEQPYDRAENQTGEEEA
jgi:hypothetical protein